MTLIVVHSNEVYCDSYCTYGDADSSTSKVRKMKTPGNEDLTFSFAGNVTTGMEFVTWLADHHHSEWPRLDCGSFGADQDHTCVVVRAPSGQLYTAFLGDKRPHVGRILNEDNTGLQLVFGSGQRWFMAYYAEHKDLFKALDLTCALHRDVAHPIERF